MRNAKILKTYFRNQRRYGRTTTLLVDGAVVFVAMGCCTKSEMIRNWKHAAIAAPFAVLKGGYA